VTIFSKYGKRDRIKCRVSVSYIKPLARFFFSHKRRKRKSYQKENAVGKFRSLRRATKALPLETVTFLKKGQSKTFNVYVSNTIK